MSSSSSSVEIRNVYQTIPKRYLEKTTHYPNEKKLGISLPSRILVIGSSGSGKTNWVCNFIRLTGCWRRIYIFAKMIDEPLYKALIDYFQGVEKKLKTDIIYFSNDPEDIPSPDKIKTDGQPTLVILDDLINAKNLGQTNVADLFTMGRKYNLTTIFLSQSFYRIPMIIRQNSTTIILKKIASNKDFKRICSEYSIAIDPKDLAALYTQCVKSITDFLQITPGDFHGNIFRCNFVPLAIQTNEAV